jgi:transposase
VTALIDIIAFVFGTSQALGAHLGLTPRAYQSGQIDRSGQAGTRGDRMLRHLVYEAASMLFRLRTWVSESASVAD